MTDRMAKLDRLLSLVHALHETSDGLTLDEMAECMGVTRRTAERMRDVIGRHFDLEEQADDRRKRFRIRDSLRRVYTRPSAAEVAALQAEADARAREHAPAAALLASLLAKVKGALDDREKRRIDPDLDALARLQRNRVPAGPAVAADPDALAAVQGAIMAGSCLEFEYIAEGKTQAAWRRIVPFGLVHGAITYVIGQMPAGNRPPVPYRLDRMTAVQISNQAGCPPEDWDVDTWLSDSFGVWREDHQDIVLRVLPAAVPRAREWRFHPVQTCEDDGDTLIIRFRAGGLREIAEHVFTWGGDVVIEGPDELRKVMQERIILAWGSV